MHVKQRLPAIFSTCFVFLCFGINIVTIKNGHSWGDDFAHYLILAKNLIAHNLYSSGVILDTPTTYPIGYPFLLSILIRVFGFNFSVFKAANIIFWYGTIAFVFPLMQKEIGRVSAVLSCLYLSSSFYFFMFKQSVLSDLLFSLFLAMTISFFHRQFNEKSNTKILVASWNFWFLMVLLVCSFLIRSAGAALFIAFIYYFLVCFRNWKISLSTFLIFLMSAVILKYSLGMGSGFFNKLFAQPETYFSFFLTNYVVVFKGFLWSLFPFDFSVGFSRYSALAGMTSLIALVLIVLVVFVFVRNSVKGTLSFLECFLFFYLGMLLVCSSFNDPAVEFAKYFLPILPYIFIVSLKNLQNLEKFLNKKRIGSSFARRAWIVLMTIGLLYNVVMITKHYSFSDDVLEKTETVELFDWVKNNIELSQHYLFKHPRAMALMTDRVGTSTWALLMKGPLSLDGLITKMKSLGVKYLIFVKKDQIQQIQLFQRDPNFMKYVWQNKEFIIYEVREDG